MLRRNYMKFAEAPGRVNECGTALQISLQDDGLKSLRPDVWSLTMNHVEYASPARAKSRTPIL